MSTGVSRKSVAVSIRTPIGMVSRVWSQVRLIVVVCPGSFAAMLFKICSRPLITVV